MPTTRGVYTYIYIHIYTYSRTTDSEGSKNHAYLHITNNCRDSYTILTCIYTNDWLIWFQIWVGLRWSGVIWLDLGWSGLIWGDLVWPELIWADLSWSGWPQCEQLIGFQKICIYTYMRTADRVPKTMLVHICEQLTDRVPKTMHIHVYANNWLTVFQKICIYTYMRTTDRVAQIMHIHTYMRTTVRVPKTYFRLCFPALWWASS